MTDEPVDALPPSANAVDIIIVNWNSGAQLQACLTSIAQYADDIVRAVIVVDNASTDGSSSALDADGVQLTVIDAGGNLGFGRACNLGAARARAPLLLFLNPDTALQADTLQNAVRFFSSADADDVAVVGIKLVDSRGDVQHHTTLLPRFTNIFTHEQRSTPFDHLQNRPVHHVIGAFYLVRSSVFRAVDGFDERFFMYLEDLDLSQRIGDAGWKVYYFAEAEAFHKGGGVSEQVKAKRLFYSMRSRIQFSIKHFSFAGASFVTLVTLTAEPVLRLARAVSRGSLSEAQETLSAFGQLYKSLPTTLRRRR